MSEVLTAAQMRAIEAAAIASGAVTGLELMERAGAGVVAAVLEEWPEMALTPQRAVVLCGPGNNGGDGFVVARLLAGRGWAVEVYLYGDAGKLPPDARVNYQRWLDVGEVTGIPPDGDFDVIVDALFGTGLTRPLDGDLVAAIEGLVERTLLAGPNSKTKIVAVDIVSGVCADSGRELGCSAPYFAHLTVTFHRAKAGHYMGHYTVAPWALRIVDIGLEDTQGAVSLTSCPRRRLGKPVGHKFSHGHALIVSGDHGHAGAARMAARAALRIGAGLVTVASPLGAMAENAARLDAVMLRLVADAVGLAEVLADARITAVCLGPGMGVARAAELLPVAVRAKHAPYLVLDADALTAVAQDQGLFALLNDRCVLTPHAGEFARLFPDIAAKLAAPAVKGPAYSKVDATREAAARSGCVVLYKGADTVIAAPDGRCSINAAVYERSAPWLATAGSGDVLAGFITGLLARGFQPMQAAETAAWLHVECARSFGPGLIAEDLPEELPKVFRALGV
ncbi:MAG: NAD(P)H-hydrate dehydratase [Cypionkella sp.]|uniref:NAD(P)H-hydrate dehydratase n=1 Tax=Cypionkella sp. TaxID=2811411 RepID=UPI002AB90295|nr:NAD(P)H-hydrate dehydratase [Cypionkella sp.]MDZ4310835.1 NAD(P)H-hydrate dehydratase [Cypionkella sp.]